MNRALPLVCLLVVACSRSAVRDRATDTPPSPSTPTEADLARFSPPLPEGLVIAIEPDVRAWDAGDGVHAIEATIVFENRGSRPIEIDPSILRLRDDQRVLHASGSRGSTLDRRTLGPGDSTGVAVIASPARVGEHGTPSVLRVDYGYVGRQTPEVRAPVTVYGTSGLVASYQPPSMAVRVNLTAIAGHGDRWGWRVRIPVELTNPSAERRRIPFGGFSASREDGTPSYWGDEGGFALERDWLEPGGRAPGTLVLMFPDAPTPPSRVSVVYAEGRPTSLDVPTR